jgi:hypothetical protein
MFRKYRSDGESVNSTCNFGGEISRKGKEADVRMRFKTGQKAVTAIANVRTSCFVLRELYFRRCCSA